MLSFWKTNNFFFVFHENTFFVLCLTFEKWLCDCCRPGGIDNFFFCSDREWKNLAYKNLHNFKTQWWWASERKRESRKKGIIFSLLLLSLEMWKNGNREEIKKNVHIYSHWSNLFTFVFLCRLFQFWNFWFLSEIIFFLFALLFVNLMCAKNAKWWIFHEFFFSISISNTWFWKIFCFVT